MERSKAAYVSRGRLGLSSGAAAAGTFSAEMIEPALKAAEEGRDEVVTEFHKALYLTLCQGTQGFMDEELSVSAMDLQEPGTGPLADYREFWVCVEWNAPPDEVVDDGDGGYIVTGSPRRCVSYAPVYVPSNI